jgi:hypothetical protein
VVGGQRPPVQRDDRVAGGAAASQIGAGDVGCGDEKIRVVDTLLGAFLPSAIGAAKQIGAALEHV